ncbi:MAG TPA: Mu transposase C-terminal domain-containing protein [Ktedonobacteraceae bacterium]|nr:Mu transposase C-terminal domain-containing protein [Ktedonobacteraceae bacterium]
MAKALDGLSLETYCRRLNFGEKTRKLLDEIRSSPPSRTPESRKGNVVVSYPSPKNQCIIKAESGKGEFAFVLEAEHDDEVLEFYDQPPSFPLEYVDRRNHVQRPLYTADYFVFRYDSAGWEECKPAQELIRQAQQKPGRFQLDKEGNWRCPPGEAYAASFGLTYKVRSSDQINWAAQDNWLYLDDYYQDLARLKISQENLKILYGIVDAAPGITLSDLRREASALPSDVINIAIARHALYVDMNRYRLSEPGRTPVFRNVRAARAYSHRGKEAVDVGIEARPILIAPGSPVIWDGIEWRIGNDGKTEITLLREGVDPFPLARSAFEVLVKKGKIQGVERETRTSITPEGQELLERARAIDVVTANFRDRVIHPEQYHDDEQVRNAKARAKVPDKTKRTWLRQFRDAEILYGSGYIGLIPRYCNCRSERKLDPKTIELIHEVLDTHFLTTTRKPKRGAYGEFVKLCKERGIPKTTERTFYQETQRYKSIYDLTVAREGTRAAYPFKDYVHSTERTISRHGDYAWAMAHLDHMEVSLQLCDSKTRKPIGKCWLTLLILSHPRRIAAYYLTYDPPSYRSCMMVLRLCVQRYGRLPSAITVDGGKEFRSIYFEKLLAAYRVRKHQRPASEPRFGSPLERLFGTMETEFIDHLLGNTQAAKESRLITKATDPRRHAVWTLKDLAARLKQWADEEYDTIRHPALGQSPREAYEQSMQRDGARAHKLIPYDDVFIKATLPAPKREEVLVQPGRGVRMNYLDYWCEEMRQKEVQRTLVKVRYDPFDVSKGYAFIEGKWRECRCPLDEMSDCSERERQVLASELRKRNRDQHGGERVEITQQQLAEFRRENVAIEEILRQQRNDRETAAAFSVLEGGRTIGVRSNPPPQADLPEISTPIDNNAQVSQEVMVEQATSQQDNDKLIIFRRVR